jgi:site-specific DNA recombinase
MRCVVYARYSTDRQTESSIEDQLRVCREFIAAQGWQVKAEHSDRGISGAALGNRPGAQAALAAVSAGDVLVINDLSRLSRSQDLAPLIARLRHRGVRVIGVQDAFDTDSRTHRMQAGLSGIMSEEFRAMVADRTRSALEQRARDGRPTGGKAFEDAALVLEIFTRFAAGESLRAIASDLNRRGIPSPGANWKERGRPRGKWLVSALHAMLHNERYIGRVIWNRSQWIKDPDTNKRHRRERPESEWIIREVEPVVNAETWATCQARFRTNAGRGGKAKYLLSGLLTCGVCGGNLVIVGGKNDRGLGSLRYGCALHKEGGHHACSNGISVSRVLAEELLLEPVMRDLLAPDITADAIEEMRRERAAMEREAPSEDRELAELERLVREGILSAEIAAPSLAAARRKAQDRRLEQSQGLMWPSVAAYKAAVAEMRTLLTGEDIDAARELLREHVGQIRCVPENGNLVAEIDPEQRVLLATGTGGRQSFRWLGSGGVQRINLTRRSRHGQKKP